MNKIKLSYGICIKNCEIQNRNTNKKKHLVDGELIRILESEYHNGSGDATSDTIIVKLYNAEDNNFKTDMFECSKKYTDYVFENLWLYLIGTKDSQTRAQIYKERESVLALRVGHEILIKTYDNDNNANIRSVVHLIGPIKEAGIGNFVGLKFLLSQPEKPQTMLNLHKRHYNATLQLHIFRIEQLLDALKHDEQNSGQIHRSDKTVQNKKPI